MHMPTATATAVTTGVQRDDRLELPMHQRVVVQYALDAQGRRELRLYHERQEISFDDAAMFAFGETLARQSHFVAGDAADWGPGYAWATVQELLTQLVDAQVLRRMAPGEAVPQRRQAEDGARPHPLPPAPAQHPRRWQDADTVLLELTGRPLDPGWLELVVPIFRVAHMALDADGRQVGEANVFPPTLRLEVPTRWRTCIYSGTRHRSERPMNVTALKAMRAHWGSMMALVLQMRQAYLRRFPEAAAGWTVGHLERLSTAVLAVPTWLLMRQRDPVANGALHPALSSLFRVTDGVRMVMHQMLFVPIGEPSLQPDAPMTASEIHAYAERNYSFHSEHGVCAGPQAMIDDFLSVLVDGRMPRDGLPTAFEPPIAQAMREVEPALDYALRGLQAYAVVFSLWPSMARSIEAMASVLERWADGGPAAIRAWHVRWQGHLERLQASSYLGTESRRNHRDHVYGDMLAACTRGLAGEPAGLPLSERLLPKVLPGDAVARQALGQALRRHVVADGEPLPEQDQLQLWALVDAVMDHLRRVQAVIREATPVQSGINRLLGRIAPRQPLTAAELDLHNQLQGAATRQLPYLIDELQAVFDIAISVTATTIAITTPHSAGKGLAVPRA
jgi:hypothetical protein